MAAVKPKFNHGDDPLGFQKEFPEIPPEVAKIQRLFRRNRVMWRRYRLKRSGGAGCTVCAGFRYVHYKALRTLEVMAGHERWHFFTAPCAECYETAYSDMSQHWLLSRIMMVPSLGPVAAPARRISIPSIPEYTSWGEMSGAMAAPRFAQDFGNLVEPNQDDPPEESHS